MLTETPAKFYFQNCSVFRKVIKNTGTWSFGKEIDRGKEYQLGFLSALCVMIENSKVHDNSSFDWLPDSSAVSRFRTDQNPDKNKNLAYPNFDFVEAFFIIQIFHLEHIEDDVITPFIALSSFNGRYNLYVFEFSCQKYHISAQSTIVEYKVHVTMGAVSFEADTTFGIVITSKLLSIFSDRGWLVI